MSGPDIASQIIEELISKVESSIPEQKQEVYRSARKIKGDPGCKIIESMPFPDGKVGNGSQL